MSKNKTKPTKGGKPRSTQGNEAQSAEGQRGIPTPFLPQFDGLLGTIRWGNRLDKAICEHSSLMESLFARHTDILKRHFAWANPVKRAYFYCTAIDAANGPCTFAGDTEKEVQDHIRERHPGTGAVPRRFGLSRFEGGMASIGPSCSVTAVVAALATTTGEYQQSDLLRKAFRTSSVEDSRAFLQALNLTLPNSPAAVLGALAAQDAATSAFFEATECSDTFCKLCGTTEEGERMKTTAVLTYTAPPGLTRESAAKSLEDAFGPETAEGMQKCSVCGHGAQPGGRDGQPCIHLTRFLFKGAAAVTVVPPPALPNNRGLPEIPLETRFPTQNGAATPFLLHAALCVTTPTHLVAYVVERAGERTNWHLYDGTVHKEGVRAPEPGKVRMLIFVPAPARQTGGGGGDGDDEEDPGGRRAGVRPPPPPPPPTSLGNDALGRELFGIVLPEGSGDDAEGTEDSTTEDEHDAEEDQTPPPPGRPGRPRRAPATPKPHSKRPRRRNRDRLHTGGPSGLEAERGCRARAARHGGHPPRGGHNRPVTQTPPTGRRR